MGDFVPGVEAGWKHTAQQMNTDLNWATRMQLRVMAFTNVITQLCVQRKSRRTFVTWERKPLDRLVSEEIGLFFVQPPYLVRSGDSFRVPF